MNERIAKWFQNGDFYQALVGKDGYFVMDHTYRNHHDVLLVIHTMIEWAFNTNNIDSCTANFSAALSRICKEDPLTGLDIINCYLIATEGKRKVKLPVKWQTLQGSLNYGLKIDHGYSQEQREQIKSLLNAIKSKRELSNFAKGLKWSEPLN